LGPPVGVPTLAAVPTGRVVPRIASMRRNPPAATLEEPRGNCRGCWVIWVRYMHRRAVAFTPLSIRGLTGRIVRSATTAPNAARRAVQARQHPSWSGWEPFPVSQPVAWPPTARPRLSLTFASKRASRAHVPPAKQSHERCSWRPRAACTSRIISSWATCRTMRDLGSLFTAQPQQLELSKHRAFPPIGRSQHFPLGGGDARL
jgi:hypothetical protein